MNFGEKIYAYRDEIVENLSNIVKIKSVSVAGADGKPFGEGPYNALQYALNLARNLGFKAVDLDGYIGYADDKGVIHFRSRLKRMIISNGYNIYPANIEDVTLKCKNVSACAAVGREDKLRGEKVVVFIVANEGASERAIKKELNTIYKKHLAKYEIPRELEFVQELPKTKLGKVDFMALKNR